MKKEAGLTYSLFIFIIFLSHGLSEYAKCLQLIVGVFVIYFSIAYCAKTYEIKKKTTQKPKRPIGFEIPNSRGENGR